MNRLAVKLRIGEKIAIGFGSICLIFLAVIWQYHTTLQGSLRDYLELQEIHEAKKSSALAIANSIQAARLAEKDFLMERAPASVQDIERRITEIYAQTEQLAAIDEASIGTAGSIKGLTDTYHRDFLAVVEAWRDKGVDHDSGLQGAFREAVHQLEKMAAQLNVGRSYVQLLQIRRSEKDLGLRREVQYRTKVFSLIDGFEQEVASSGMDEETRDRLLAEISVYRSAFEAYSDTALANEDIRGGKGAFRQSAHRIEEILNAHYVPDLDTSILQLRRREKDYLLRHDKAYVDMVQAELSRIHQQVDASLISTENKARFRSLLSDYERDFNALVDQNDRIDRLIAEMGDAVSKITDLAEENVIATEATMRRVSSEINRSSLDRARAMWWIVASATLLGVLFAVLITLRISRPLRQMAALLDQLAYEAPVARMASIPGGRDEVNAMAESVNTMADHKARFIDWWKGAMRENDACRKLHTLLTTATPAERTSDELPVAIAELTSAIQEKDALCSENQRRIEELNAEVLAKSDQLIAEEPEGRVWLAAQTIRHSAKSIDNVLKMMAE